MKFLAAHILVVMLASLLNSIPVIASTAISEPSGVYALIGARVKVSQITLDNPDVSGVVLRDVWSLIEAQQGTYDWSYLDSELARLSTSNKKIMLSVTSGSVTGSPTWLLSLDVKPFSYKSGNKKLTIPLYWDPIFLQQKKNFIRALGARYSSNPQLVSVHAHCLNSNSDDWYVPSTATDIKNLLALGYTTATAIDICKQIIDATMEAFPNQVVRMAVGSINAAMDSALNDSDYVQKEIIAYANATYPGRFYAQRHNLNAQTPDPFLASPSDRMGGWRVIFDDQPYTAAQMLWWVTNDPACTMNKGITPCDPATVLGNAITLGAVQYGMRYLEIYEADIKNPDLAAVISDAAILLNRP